MPVQSLHAAPVAPAGLPAPEEHGRGKGGKRVGKKKQGKRFPVWLVGSSRQLFWGASFPSVLQLAPTCAAGESSLTVSVAARR